MDIVVNDTNIFLDLISVGLLDVVFKLPIKFHTVDYVIAEIADDMQRKSVQCVFPRMLTIQYN